MGALAGQLLTLICGSFLTIFLFSMTNLIQHFPQIIHQLFSLLKWLLRISFIVYEWLLNQLLTLVRAESPRMLGRTIITLIFSLSLAFGLFLLFKLQIQVFAISVAIAHGLYLGIAWDMLADPEGLRLGVDIE